MPTPLVPYKTTQLKGGLLDAYNLWSRLDHVPQSNDYDMKGFYLGGLLGDPEAKSAVNPSDLQLHFNDKWKLPNHHSFSNESMYSTANDDPYWVNPIPYKNDTWAQYSKAKKGLINMELPASY